MKKPLGLIAVSAFFVFATMLPGKSVFADEGNVEVRPVYVNGGHGIQFYLDSTVDATVCAFPYVESQENVYGALGGDKFQMGPNEQGVNIGAFNQANSEEDWSVYVGAKYKNGECADQ